MVLRWLLLVATLGASAAAQDDDLPAIPERPVERIVVPGDDTAVRFGDRLARREQPWRHLSFSGRVVAPDGSPLAGADVWLIPNGEALVEQGYAPHERVQNTGLGGPPPTFFDDVPLAEMAHVPTDAEGAFRLEGPWRESCLDVDVLFPGMLLPLVVIASPGYATRVDQALTWPQLRHPVPDAIDLGSIPMEPESRVAGRIVDEKGAPLSGVGVRVVDWACKPEHFKRSWYFLNTTIAGLHDARTGEDGRFEIAGQFPGQLKLELQRPDRGRCRTKDLPVAPQTVNDLGDVILPAGDTLSGTVVDSAGRPVPRAAVHAVTRKRENFGFGCVVSSFKDGDDTFPVELTERNDCTTVSTLTDARGGFTLATIWDETLTLYAEAPGFEPARAERVAPGTEDLRLQLRAGAAYIVRPTGPFDRVRLEAYRACRIEPRAMLPNEDCFALPVVADSKHPGCYRIEGVGPVSTLVFVSADRCRSTRYALPGLAPGEEREVTLALEREQEIRGLVLDAGGLPLAGALVDLTAPDKRYTGLVLGTATGPDGRFRFGGLGDGVWDVVVDGPDCIEACIEKVQASPVAEGKDLAEAPALVVQLERGGTIVGRIERPGSGSDLSNDSITLNGVDYAQVPFGKFGRFGSPFTMTDRAGRFEFHGVRPGRHVISETFRKAKVEVEVRVGETSEVVLVLPEDDER